MVKIKKKIMILKFVYVKLKIIMNGETYFNIFCDLHNNNNVSKIMLWLDFKF